MEKFFKIENYSNYLISKSGVLKRLKIKSPGTFTSKDYILKFDKSKNGYIFYSLKNDLGVKKRISQHRLLATVFIENPNKYKCVNHKNGIRDDNRLENLEWCNHSQNAKHGYESNNRKNPMRKLTESQVLEIKSHLINYKHGDGRRLSKKYNVSTWIISLIKNNKSYASV